MTHQPSTTPGLLSSYLQSITNEYSDVTLECEGHIFSCHKIILAAQSKFFSSLFSDIFCGGDDASHSVFRLPGVTKTGLEQVINFLYCRPMHIIMETVWRVVKDADFLLMDEVADECSAFIISNLRTDNCLGISAMAEQYHLARLSVQVDEFIMHNIKEMSGTEEFLAMECSALVRLLEDDRLVVREEEEVWRLALLWMESRNNRREQMEKVILAIRFGLMERDYFLKNVVSHPYVTSSPFLQEVTQYLAVMDNPTISMAKMLNDKYNNSTPKFAMPRLPSEFLLQIGGFTTSPAVDMTVYDMKSDRWTKLELELPDGLAYPSAESVGGNIVLAGGVSQHPSHPPSFSRNTWIIDLNKQVVKKVPDMKLRRNFVATAVVGETVYALGGRSSGESRRLSECEKMDLRSRKLPLNWERIQSVRPGRSDAGAVGVKDKVWMVGGFDGENCLSIVQVLHTLTGRWGRGPALHTARSGLSCVYLGGWIYAAGGMDGVSRLRSVERIKPGDRRWERVEDMIHPRSNFSLVALEGRLVAAGGFNGISVTTDVEIFDPQTGVWTKVENMLEGKSGMASVVVDRRVMSKEVLKFFTYGGKEGLMVENITRKRREVEMVNSEEEDCDNSWGGEEEELLESGEHEISEETSFLDEEVSVDIDGDNDSDEEDSANVNVDNDSDDE